MTMYNLLLEGRFKNPLYKFKKRSYFFFDWLDGWFFKRTKTFFGLKAMFANLDGEHGLGLLKDVGKFYYNKDKKKKIFKKIKSICSEYLYHFIYSFCVLKLIFNLLIRIFVLSQILCQLSELAVP